MSLESQSCQSCGTFVDKKKKKCPTCGSDMRKQGSVQPISFVKPIIQTSTILQSSDASSPQSVYQKAQDLKKEDYTVEVSAILSGKSYKNYILRDHTGSISFTFVKSSRFKANYKIYNEHDVELGQLKGGMTYNAIVQTNTIVESQTRAKSKVSFERGSGGQMNQLNVETQAGNFSMSDFAMTDTAYVNNLYDSQNNLALTITMPRKLNLTFLTQPNQNKSNILATIRGTGQLNAFLSCAIGVVMTQMSQNIMMSRDVVLLDKSTEIVIDRKTRLDTTYIFSDDKGREILKGKPLILSQIGIIAAILGIILVISGFLGFSAFLTFLSPIGIFILILGIILIYKFGWSTYSFTDSTGQKIGTVEIKRNDRYIITETQRGIVTIIDFQSKSNFAKETNRSKDQGEQNSRTIRTFEVGKKSFMFGAGSGSFSRIREIYDSKENLVFTILGYNDAFKLDIKHTLTPNFWCMVATCLIDRYFIPQDTSGSGGG